MKKYTIRDIAEMAGVSPRTVSRVLNKDERVSPKTKKRILDVIKKTGYEVNLIARSLRKRETGILIVFVGESNINYIGNFHNSIIRYIDIEANKVGYKTIISRSSAYKMDENIHDGFYLLKNGFADGAILFDTRQEDPRVRYLVEKKIPFVIVGKDTVYKDTSYVNLDNVKAGYMGAEHLIKRGYESIIFFLGDKDFTVNKDRAQGFISACKRYGISYFKIYYGITNVKLAYEYTKKILDSENIPRAIFVSGDERAHGTYHAIYEKGLRIPDDVAVLSIDNIPLSKYYFPPLTTIDQSVDKMAKEAIRILYQHLKNPEEKKTERIMLPPILMVRKST